MAGWLSVVMPAKAGDLREIAGPGLRWGDGSARLRDQRPLQLLAAASMIGTNCAAVRLAPPTRAPSTSSTANSSAALPALTEPP